MLNQLKTKLGIDLNKNTAQLLYYLNIHLCVLAMALSAAGARVLTGRIEWIPVVIVGLGTYVIYNIDNLVDWSKESHLLETKNLSWNSYKISCLFTVPLSLSLILILSFLTRLSFLLFLAGLGLISGLYIVITLLVTDHKVSAIALHSVKIVDALVWSIVIVLIPVQYSRHPIGAQTVMALTYTWMLIWVGVMVWDMSYAVQSKNNLHTLAKIIGEGRVVSLSKIACVSALVLAVIDVLLGYFPWYNLSVIGWPLLSFFMLGLWPKLRRIPRLYHVLFCSINIIGAALVIITYNLFE